MKQKLLRFSLLSVFVLLFTSGAWAAEGDVITNHANIVSGKSYYITVDFSGTTHYLTFTDATTSGVYGTSTTTKSDGQIITIVKVPETENDFYLMTANGYYLAPIADNGKIKITTTATSVTASSSSNLISFSIKSGNDTWILQRNSTVATNRFGGYKSTQKKVTLVEAAAKADPTVTFNNGSVRVGQNLDLSTLLTTNSTGATTYSITAGETYATLTGSVLTGVAEGSVTVKVAQMATGSYNAAERTATITVQPIIALSSIAVTTPPTKTAYIEGNYFDPAGLVVTATYADESTADVTASCVYTPSLTTALTTSNTSVSISYTENGTEKTTTQAITVNPDPNSYATLTSTNMSNMSDAGSGYGTSKTIVVDGLAWETNGFQDKTNNVTNMIQLRSRGHSSGVSYIKLPTFSGKIQKITFAVTGTSATSADAAGVNTVLSFQSGNTSDETVIASSASTVSNEKIIDLSSLDDDYNTGYITLTSGYGARIWNLSVAYLPTDISVEITSAKYATFSDHLARDFSATGIKVYTAKVDAGVAKMTEVTSGLVPANTGVILYNATADIYNVPVAANAPALDNNELVGINFAATVSFGTDPYNYILQLDGTTPKFYKAAAEGATLAAHRAYLSTSYEVPAASRELAIDFGDATAITGIDAVGAQTAPRKVVKNGRVVIETNEGTFSLNGARVK